MVISTAKGRHYLRDLFKWGIDRQFWYKWIIDVANDFRTNQRSTFGQKLWAYRRGFLSSRSRIYGLTEDNYKNYLSDLDYFRVQPINRWYSHWINDKLTVKYMLFPFNQYMPRYYYHLGHNQTGRFVARLMDCPPGYGTTTADIIRLLQSEGSLAAKLVAGTRGEGFNKISYRDSQYYLNHLPVSESEMLEFLDQLDRYLITEYLYPHQELSRIWAKSSNTLRVVVINDDGSKPQIASSSMRFGTERSGHVDMMIAGGIGTVVDLKNGNFSRAKIMRDGELVDCLLHPDTKVPVEGTLPFWPEIVTTVEAIGRYLPHIRFMAYDIIITESGFKIIEINSRPWVYFENYNQPFYTHPVYGRFFRRLLKR